MSEESMETPEQPRGPGDDLFSKIFHASSDGFTISGLTDGRIFEVNDAFLQISGYAREEVLGKTSIELNLWREPEDRKRLVKRLKKQGTVGGEMALRAKSGEMRHGFFSARTVEIDGRPNILATFRDQTESVLADLALRQSGERFDLVTRATQDAVWDWDVVNDHMWWNQRCYEVLEFEPGKVVPGNDVWADRIHPDDRERVFDAFNRAVEGKDNAWTAEYRLLLPSGKVTTVFDKGLIRRDEDGHPTRVLGTFNDITERKQSEEQLRETEAKYRNLVERIPAATYLEHEDPAADRLLRMVYMSPQIESITGYAPNEYIEDAVWEKILHPDDRNRVLSQDLSSTKTGEPFATEYRLVHRDGRTVWVHDEAIILRDEGGARSWQGFMIDITARKLAEQELSSREAELSALVSAMSDVILILDKDGRYMKIPSTNPSLLYRPADDLIGKTLHEIFPVEQADYFLAQIRAALEGGTTVHFEYSLPIEEREVWFAGAASPMAEDTIVLVARDITQRKQAEEQLSQAEKRFRTLIEESPAVTYMEEWIDPDGVPSVRPDNYVSPQIEAMLGFSAEERINDPEMWQRQLHPEDREIALTQDAHSSRTGEPFKLEYRMIARDGSTVWVRDEAVLVRDDGGRPSYWLGVMQDITERKRAEAEASEYAKRLNTLLGIDKAILAAQSAEEIAATALAQIRALSACERASIVEFDNKREEFLILALSSESETKVPAGTRFPLDQFPVAELEEGRARVIENLAETTPSSALDKLRREGMNAALSMPLVAEGELIGTLNLFSTQLAYFTAEHQELAAEAGQMLAVAIRQARLHEQVEQYANELEQRLRELRSAHEERRELLIRLVRAQETERQKIASDIHDDSIQKMAAVGLRLASLRKGLGEEKQIDHVKQLESIVELSISRLRHLMFELWPPALDRHGLAVAVKTELDQTAVDTGLSCSFEDRLETEPPVETRTIAYRIVQEAVANVRKHAEASRLDVILESKDGGIAVKVKDDGKGFTPSRTEESRPGHLGLFAMRERADMAGGWLRVESTPGGGTLVDFWLPVESGASSSAP
ncbi:MAG: PAS domain-containing protein [Actinomycetota bacterium]